MRHFARAGWDTFALDLEGFGLSTRPLVMDDPAAFPDSKAPIHSDVTLRDVDRAVDFIGGLRGIERVDLLGWSLGASLEAPLYATRHPEKVERLVLFGVSYDNSKSIEERQEATADDEAQKVMHSVPSLDRWRDSAPNPSSSCPAVSICIGKRCWRPIPSRANSGVRSRVPTGRSADKDLAQPHFDAAKITMPTLVIRGEADSFAKRDDDQRLMNALGSTVKQYVEIPNAGHFLHFEHANLQFYEAVQKFLEAEK